MPQTIIIGAGIGGLSASIELAAKGFQVTVVEATSVAGGKAGTIVHEGIEADTGPSVLTLPDVFRRLFTSAGRNFDEEITLIQANPGFRYIYPDNTVLDVFHEIEDTLDSVQATLGTDARSELSHFLKYSKKIWDASADTFVFGNAPSLGEIMKLGFQVLKKLPAIDATRTMASAIRQKIRTPHLRDLLLRYATYNGSSPFSAPATLNCIAHVELAMGGYGIQGGIYTLVRTLTDIAVDLGVQFIYNAPVDEILVTGNKVHGIRLRSGKQLSADTIVANAEPRLVFEHLLPPEYRSQLAPLPASTSGWTAILRSSANLKRGPHTVVFPSNYEEEFRDLFDRKQTPQEPTLYLCDQALTHARKGWDTAVPVFLMVNTPDIHSNATANWRALETRAHQKLAALQLIETKASVIWRRSPDELATAFPGSYGALYGAASNSMWSAFRRPKNQIRHPRGLYLASGAAHPGGGLPLCVASGQAASRAIIHDLQQ